MHRVLPPQSSRSRFPVLPGLSTRRGKGESCSNQEVLGDVLDADRRQEELGALVELSEAMTSVAFEKVGTKHKPWQPSPTLWMPVPYLAFCHGTATRLIGLLAERPPQTLRDSFCDSATTGLPLVAACDLTDVGPAADERKNAVGSYWFRDEGAVQILMRVPGQAELLVQPGQVVPSGRPWCRLLAESRSNELRALPRIRRWAALTGSCTDRNSLQRLMAGWTVGPSQRSPSESVSL